jgi:outer membrane protein assembly factor BamB
MSLGVLLPASLGAAMRPIVVPLLVMLLGLALAPPGCSSHPSPAATTVGKPPASATPTQQPAVTGGGWPTYHADLKRTGLDPSGTVWTTVKRQWESETLDGDIYAEPLVIGEQVIVATENDSLYSLDLSTGSVIWRTHLGDPVPGNSLPCGNIDPSGITGTPVADPGTGLVYAVAFVQPARHDLVAVDVTSGAVQFRLPVDPAGADPRAEQQRAALALSQGTVYVAFGGLFGDCGPYHGWVVAIRSDGSGQPLSYRVAAERRAGIWAPSGPAIDAAGSVFVATGNSDAVTAPDLGDSVLRLSADLRLLDSFTPSDWADLNGGDVDLGSVSPALLDSGLLFQIGKSGIGYLLQTDHLGGIGGQVYSARVCNGAYGGTAYSPPYLYVPCREGLVAIKISPAPSFTTVWRGPSFNAGPPIVAGGVVWTLDLSQGTLYGLDPASGETRYREPVGSVTHFTTPSAAERRLLVAATRQVIAFGEE